MSMNSCEKLSNVCCTSFSSRTRIEKCGGCKIWILSDSGLDEPCRTAEYSAGVVSAEALQVCLKKSE